MEVGRARALREAWQSAGDSPCPHTGLDAESTESGYFTGRYVCKTCGHHVQVSTRPASDEPEAQMKRTWSRYALYTSMGLLTAAVPILTAWYKRKRCADE